MNYTEALLFFETITPSIIKDAETIYGETLLSVVAPKHVFKRYVGMGLEGIIILAEDVENMRNSVFKFARPKKNHSSTIEKLGKKVKNIFSARNDTSLKESPTSERFLRSCRIQQQIYKEIQGNKELRLIGGVPSIYKIGKIPKLYVEMEYTPGADLLTWCKFLPSEQAIVQTILDISKLINGIHNINIIHGDLKPQNFIIQGVDDNYRVLLIDFGTAKDVANTFCVTQEGEQRFSMPYTSGNQIKNYKSRTFSDDIYSVGVMLYYCVLQTTPVEQFNKYPDSKTFKDTHPLHLLKHIGLQQVYSRAVGYGFKYPKIQDFIEDINKRYFSTIKKSNNLGENTVEKIVQIWSEFLKRSKYCE